MGSIVVGAGLSGLIVAAKLHEQGHPTMVLERDSIGRKKVCGGCLNRRGVKVLERSGFAQLLVAAPALTSAELHFRKRKIALKGDFGIAISRGDLDASLVRAVKRRGTQIAHETTVKHLEEDGHVLLSSGETLFAETIVNAAGLRGRSFISESRPSGRIGLGCELIDQRYDLELGKVRMLFTKSGYVGLVRTSADSLILAAAVEDPQNPFEGIDRGLLPEFDLSQLLATPRLTGSVPPVSGSIFCVGDAASYNEPFSGLGMTWALEGAEALAKVLTEIPEAERDTVWRREYARKVRSKQKLTLMLQRFLKSPERLEFAAAILQRSTLSAKMLRAAFSW